MKVCATLHAGERHKIETGAHIGTNSAAPESNAYGHAPKLRDDLGPATGEDAAAIAAHYFEWLHQRVPLVRALLDDGRWVLRILGAPLIRLGPANAFARGVILPITGGWLARPGGALMFTIGDDERAHMVLERFRPALPWWVYRWTQLPVHQRIAAAFARHRAAHSIRPRS